MKQENMTIVSQKEIAPRIYELILSGKLVQEMKTPGQFLHLKVGDEAHVLRRPISIAKIDQSSQTCTLIYRTEGFGTKWFAALKTGGKLDVMGPLGNGYDLRFAKAGQKALVIGGGIGIPPMYELSRALTSRGVEVFQYLGFASKQDQFYLPEFRALGETYVSTDDGSDGMKGHVGQLIEKYPLEAEMVFACGNLNMLKALSNKFSQVPHAYFSLEARMACGVGACYGCTVAAASDPLHKNFRVCKDGPIFEMKEVEL